MSVTESVPRLSQTAYSLVRQVKLREGSKTLKLDARPLDHLLQIANELAIHRVVGSPERVQRRKASGMEDPKHAQLLKAAFVDAPVFLLCGRRNHLDARLRPASVDVSSGSGRLNALG